MVSVQELAKIIKRQKRTIEQKDRQIERLKNELRELKRSERVSRWQVAGEIASDDTRARAIMVEANEEIEQLETTLEEKEDFIKRLLMMFEAISPWQILDRSQHSRMQEKFGETVCHAAAVVAIRHGPNLGDIRIARMSESFAGTIEEAIREVPNRIHALLARAPFPENVTLRRSSEWLERETLFRALLNLSKYWQAEGITDEEYDQEFERAFHNLVPEDTHPDNVEWMRRQFGEDTLDTFKKLPQRAGRGIARDRRRKTGRKVKTNAIEIAPEVGVVSES